jgi:hypothetical protein
VTGLIAVSPYKRHALAEGFDCSIDQLAVMKRRNLAFAGFGQIDFNVAPISQTYAASSIWQHFQLLLTDFPKTFASKNALESFSQPWSNPPTASLRRLVLVTTANELDIVDQGLASLSCGDRKHQPSQDNYFQNALHRFRFQSPNEQTNRRACLFNLIVANCQIGIHAASCSKARGVETAMVTLLLS